MDLTTGDVKHFNNGVAHNQEAARPARGIHRAYKEQVNRLLETGHTAADIAAKISKKGDTLELVLWYSTLATPLNACNPISKVYHAPLCLHSDEPFTSARADSSPRRKKRPRGCIRTRTATTS